MIQTVRKDFPILDQKVQDQALIYLDNAATTQKPTQVLDRLMAYYTTENANVHRGVHTLAERATAAYEDAREAVRAFIHASSTEEVVFTRGTTTSLNWIAHSYAPFIEAGDEILVTPMEHHSNLVPWQELAKRTGAYLRFIPLTKTGQLDMDQARQLINERTRVVSVAHVSNVLGVVNPVKTLATLAHEVGAIMVVDGAQAAPHMSIDVQALDVDFYAFSGHKMCAPTGIGVLYGKKKWLHTLEPVEFGGEMIDIVQDTCSTWAALPHKWEAGTPNISGAIGLHAAIDYLNEIGMKQIQDHQADLMRYALEHMLALDGITIYGPHHEKEHTSLISFNVDGVHPHDLATALDLQGIAIRAGHHCTQPLMRDLGVAATARASFYIYNTKEDIDALIRGILAAKEFFSHGFI